MYGGLLVRSACLYDRPDTYEMLTSVVDGRVTGVCGDPDHPLLLTGALERLKSDGLLARYGDAASGYVGVSPAPRVDGFAGEAANVAQQ